MSGPSVVGPPSRTIERRFLVLTGLRWLPVGLVIPVLVLLLQARGLSVSAVGALLALYSIVTIVLELPTGGLADVLGRRPVLVAASLATAAGLTMIALAADVALLALAMSLLGAGRALSSGPLEAWYVDAVRASDPDRAIGSGLARAGAVEAVLLGLGAAVGGAMPLLAARAHPGLPTSGVDGVLTLSVPLLVAAGLMIVHAGLVLALVTEDGTNGRSSGVAARVGATMVTGVRGAARVPTLRRVLLASGAIGVVLATVELLSPGTFARLLGGGDEATAGYGVLVAVGFAMTALGSLAAARPARGTRPATVAAVSLAVAAPATMLLASGVAVVAVVGYLLVYAVLGLVGPLMSVMLHDAVDAAERSTTLSVQSLFSQAGGAIASLTVGVVAVGLGAAAGYAVAGAACLGAAWLMWGNRRWRPAAG